MNNLVAAGLFMLLMLGGIGVLLAGLGIYEWGKNKKNDNKKQ